MDLRSQLQAHLGTALVIERELGGGGMSRVFLANEVRLSRRVVVKVLNPQLVQGLNAERFEREILLVASLQQANIVPVLAAGEVEGIPYYTMPFVEGESLRSRLSGSGLGIGETVAILRDVSKALAYAHTHGIVHRDIKPDNVLLSGGTAVVTDFGIAKALADSQTAELAAQPGAALTQTGTSIGTPAYMAPEQVAGDPGVDQRVDLYALGCMAFELLVGRAPFADRSTQKMMTAHLTEVPPAIATLRGDCPPSLSDLVAKLLQKDPANRPRSAGEVLTSLDAVLTSSTPSLAQAKPMFGKAVAIYIGATAAVAILAKAAVVGIGLPDWVFPGAMVVMLLGLPALLVTGYVQRIRRHVATATPTLTPGGTLRAKQPSGTLATMALKASPHVTWRRTARLGAAALGLFVLLIAGFMIMRSLGIGAAGSLFAAGTLTRDDRIVVADFTVAREDSALATILVEGVRAAMSQSRSIRLLAPAEIAQTLEQMQRDKLTPLNATVAREVALRAGAKAVLGGRLARAGNGFAVSLELTNPAGGTLASYQGTADGPGQLLEVVDRLTRKLRGKMGESLKAVQNSVPLEQATTSSLAALRSYSEAVRANDVDGDYDRAISAARAAVKEDSTFALAWRKLAVAIGNSAGSQSAQDSAMDRAARYADKLPEREKYMVLGTFYTRSRTKNDRGKALAAFQNLYQLDSNSSVAANQLGIIYESRQQYDSALRYKERERLLIPGYTSTLNSIASLQNLGRFEVASARLDSIVKNNPGAAADPRVTFSRAGVLYGSGHRDSATALVASLQNSPIPFVRVGALGYLQNQALIDGKLSQAIAFDSQRNALLSDRGNSVTITGLTRAGVDIGWLSRPEEGTRQLDAILAGPQWNGTAPIERPYAQVVFLYAYAGKGAKARDLLKRAMVDDPSAPAPGYRSFVATAEGEIALAEKDYAEAVRLFRAGDIGEDGARTSCEDCLPFNLARAYDQAGQKDSALTYYEQYMAIPVARRSQDWFALAAVQKRLGELYDEKNDREQAIAHYSAFVDQWRNADPALQPQVAAVKHRLGELVAKEN